MSNRLKSLPLAENVVTMVREHCLEE